MGNFTFEDDDLAGDSSDYTREARRSREGKKEMTRVVSCCACVCRHAGEERCLPAALADGLRIALCLIAAGGRGGADQAGGGGRSQQPGAVAWEPTLAPVPLR